MKQLSQRTIIEIKKVLSLNRRANSDELYANDFPDWFVVQVQNQFMWDWSSILVSLRRGAFFYSNDIYATLGETVIPEEQFLQPDRAKLLGEHFIQKLAAFACSLGKSESLIRSIQLDGFDVDASKLKLVPLEHPISAQQGLGRAGSLVSNCASPSSNFVQKQNVPATERQGRHDERNQSTEGAPRRGHEETHAAGSDPADSKPRQAHGWWWTRLKTGEKVGTVLGALTLLAAIFAIPGVVDVFHWKRPSEQSGAAVLKPAPPQLSVRVRPGDDLLPDGSVRIPTNEADKLVLHRVEPDWPKGIGSKVYSAQVIVGVDGKVLGIGLDATDPQIIDIISDAITQWKFKPYLRNGKPQKFQSTFYLHS